MFFFISADDSVCCIGLSGMLGPAIGSSVIAIYWVIRLGVYGRGICDSLHTANERAD